MLLMNILQRFYEFLIRTVQLSSNFTHVCVYMCAWTRFTHVKVYNLECIFLITRGFVMRTCAIKHSWHTRHAPHKQTRHKHINFTINHMCRTT